MNNKLLKDQLDLLINSYNQKKYDIVKKIGLDITYNFPKNAFAWKILGLVFEKENNLTKAINAYQKAITNSSNDQDLFHTYFNLANTQLGIGKVNEAIINYNKSIELNPNFFGSYANLAYANQKLGDLNNAIINLDKANKLNNKSPEIFNNLGNIYRQIGNLNKSIKHLKEAIRLNPKYAKAHNNLANAYKKIGKLDEAILSYRRAIHNDKNMVSAEANMLHLKRNICDFSISDKISKISSTLGITTKSIPPFLALSWNDNPEHNYLRSKNYINENFKENFSKKNKLKYQNKKIKIGYFSADFYDFPSMHLMSGILEKHNRNFFEIYAFSYGPNNDDWMNRKIKSTVDHFLDVKNLPTKEIVELSHKNNIDIAIDENCFTSNGRTELFQNRLAGIQINFLGYPGTSGADFIDYIVADKIVIPKENKKYFTEKIIYMPHCYQPNDNLRKISSDKKTRKDFNLPEKSFVLCCFNQTYKISLFEFKIWMKILSKIEHSVLWLLKSNHWAEQNLLQEAKRNNINPNRIIFAERISQSEHLARHKHADIFIDTFNYNAHTTASDALWAGLPIVTKKGNQFAARVASSLLNSVDLNELICENEKEYENLILELSNNPSKLETIKKKLSNNKSKKNLFDTERYTKNFELGLKKVYDLFQAEKQPQDIEIVENL